MIKSVHSFSPLLSVLIIIAACDGSKHKTFESAEKNKPAVPRSSEDADAARKAEDARKERERKERERIERERIEAQETQSAYQFSNLKAWTEEVLPWDESSVAAAVSYQALDDQLSKNKIAIVEFDKALKNFVAQLTQGPLAGKNNWLDAKQAPEAFYNIEHFGADLKSTLDPESIFFGHKLKIPTNSQIVVVGDLHGSIHSLIRNLWRLVMSGYLNRDFTIAKANTYFIFTGDFVDRGRYSIECLYTLLRLKLANFDKIFLVRGNHENTNVSTRYGLLEELKLKYEEALGERVFKDITDFYRFLPVVLFAEVQGEKPAFLHFSHGGFSYDAAKRELIHTPATFLKDKNAIFELIPQPLAQGYMWSDFHQADQSIINSQRGFSDAGLGVSILGKLAFLQYSVAIKKDTGVWLAGIFRGHQDRAYGVKMLFKDTPPAAELVALRAKNLDYPDGPFHWQDVVKNPHVINTARSEGIVIDNYRPVYTFTTASEGQAVPFDAYGIINIKDAVNNYRLEIHENKLAARVAQRSYMSIAAPLSANDDGISVTWSDKPGTLSLP